MGFGYLVESANAMARSIKYLSDKDGAKQIDPKSLTVWLSTGCGTLRQLQEDQEFFALAADVGKKLNERRTELLKRMQTNFEEFISAFGKVDRGLMLDAGMDAKVVNWLFHDLQNLRQIAESADLLASASFPARIKEFGYIVCKAADMRGEEERRTQVLTRTCKVVGGAAIIKVNGLADIMATFGMMSVISGSFGGILLKDGLS